MAATEREQISTLTVVGLILVIAAADIVSNVLVPEPARVPAKLAIVVALVMWAHRRAGLDWDELGFDPERLRAGVRLGALAAMAVVVTIAVLVLVPSTRSFFESNDIAGDSTARQIIMPLVVIPLGTVLFEEILFRGVLLAALMRTTTCRAAVLASAVLFGFWHLIPALSDTDGKSGAASAGVVFGTIAVTTVAGVVFAWLRLRSGSLAAPVVAHLATNSVTYVAALFVLNA